MSVCQPPAAPDADDGDAPHSPTTSTTTPASTAPTQTTARRLRRDHAHRARARVHRKAGNGTAEGLRAAHAVVRAHGLHRNGHLRLPPQPDPARADRHRRRAPTTGTTSRRSSSSTAATSAPTPSSRARQVSVVSQSDTEVTLAYSLIARGDPLCCPSGGQAKVRFQLNNGQLTSARADPAGQLAAGLASSRTAGRVATPRARRRRGSSLS